MGPHQRSAGRCRIGLGPGKTGHGLRGGAHSRVASRRTTAEVLVSAMDLYFNGRPFQREAAAPGTEIEISRGPFDRPARGGKEHGYQGGHNTRASNNRVLG